MKYYVVMEFGRAAAANDNFSGSVTVRFYGRADVTIGGDVSGSYAEYCSETPCNGWLIAKYAYRRRCDAVRNWSFNNPENSEYWEYVSRIVEITADTPEDAADMLNLMAHAVVTYAADASRNDGIREKMKKYRDELIHLPVA